MTGAVVVGRPREDLMTGLAAVAAAARAGTGPLLLLPADLVVHPEALADLGEDPRPGSWALASRPADPSGGEPDLRVRAGRVVAVATPVHRANGADTVSTGAVRVGAEDRAAAAEVAGRLAVLADRHGWTGDPLGYLLLGLVRTGVPVGAVLLDPWPWARGAPAEVGEVQRQLAGLSALDVHRLRLRRAAKAEDGFVATFVHRPLARRLTPVALRLGMTPNQVTVFSVALGLSAAAAFAVGGRWSLAVGAVLLQLSLVVDCVDGDVARYRRMFSPVGAWLDASTDRLKEFACYGGLAWGAGSGRLGWVLASVLVALQTARHSMDYTFTAVKELREAEVVTADLDAREDPTRDQAGGARAVHALELSRRAAAGRPAVTWAKKVVHLGIAERWTLLSVFALLGRPVLGLLVLLAAAVGSLLYVLAGRVVRTRSWSPDGVSARERSLVAEQADLGPLVGTAVGRGLAGRQGGHERFLWARPPAWRAAEYVLLLAASVAVAGDEARAATFLLLMVVASHHYDLLYRVLQGLRLPAGVTRALALGAPGRVLVVVALARLGDGAATTGLWVLSAGLGILFLAVEPARLLREVRSRSGLLAADPIEGAAGA